MSENAVTPLTLPPDLRRQIESEGAASYPNECCGILVGRDATEGGTTRRLVERLEPGKNVFEADEQYHRFSIDPVQQLAAEIPFYNTRHVVRPGVTGWAQVKYRYGSSLEDAMEKLRYDLYYIKHLSVFFDLTIVFDTVKVVLFRKGAA